MKKAALKILQKFLGLLTKIYLKKSKPLIIGVTGSVGKTSCRMIISQTLKQLCDNKVIYTSPKNFNSELGIVFSIFEIENYSPGVFNLIKLSIIILVKTLLTKGTYDILVLEYGIDNPQDMDVLLNIVIPDISIFTKLDSIHLENFENLESIGKEKFKLMKKTKKLTYLNFKDEYCKKNNESIMVEKRFYNKKDFEVNNYKIKKDEGEIFSSFDFRKYKIKTNILGEENLNYISIGIDIINYLFKDERPMVIPDEVNELKKKIKKNILKYELQPGRFSILEGIKDSILIDSSYNAGPESMKKMIENTIKLKKDLFPEYKIGYILGDMRELGEESDKSHKQIGQIIKKADLIYTIGKEMKKIIGRENNFISSKKAGLKLKDYLKNTENKYILLFKGSQNTIFTEEALKQVLKNKTDINKLVRQDIYWIKKKEAYFKNL